MCSFFSKCYRFICLHPFQNNSNYFRTRTKLRRVQCTFLFIQLELFQPYCIYCETVASIPLPTRDALLVHLYESACIHIRNVTVSICRQQMQLFHAMCTLFSGQEQYVNVTGPIFSKL